jgi:hypothetical protein
MIKTLPEVQDATSSVVEFIYFGLNWIEAFFSDFHGIMKATVRHCHN